MFLRNDGKKCLSTCPDGFGVKKGNNKCIPCITSSCKSCTVGNSTCDSCLAGQALKSVTGEGCLPSCPSGETSIDLNPKQPYKKCVQCQVNFCKVCSSVETCLTCQNGYYIQPATQSETSNKCVDKCKSTQFINFATNTCENCSYKSNRAERFGAHCLTCNSQSCLSCTSGKYIQPDQTCKATCPYNYDTLEGQQRCQRCTVSNCTKCGKSIQKCEKCGINPNNSDTQAPFYLSQTNTCVSECPEKQFKDQSNLSLFKCSDCPKDCKICTEKSTCKECVANKVLQLNKVNCDDKCNVGSYADGKVCIPCFSKCKVCTSGKTCQKCITNFYIHRTTHGCVKCDETKSLVKNGDYCDFCHSSCLTCSGTLKNNCKSCHKGYSITERNYCVDDSIPRIRVTKTEFKAMKQVIIITFNQKITSSSLKKAFSYSLVNKYGNPVREFYVKSIRINSSGNGFIISVKISQNVKNGKLIMTKFPYNPDKLLQGVIVSRENSALSFNKDIEIPQINVDTTGIAGNMDSIGSIGGPALKSATFLTMIVSISASIALIKIFQMMDYMVLFSVAHPNNFQKFVDVFSSNFFSDFPNLFTFLVDDDCGKMKEKFEENNMSCQFLSNCGPLIVILILVVLMKLMAWVMDTALTSSTELRSNLSMKVHQFNEGLNFEFFISFMDMFQLDFYLAIYLQFSSFEIRSSKSSANIFSSLVVFIVMLFLKLILYFYSTRIANIRSMKKSLQEKGYVKNYYNFLFLSQENHGTSYYAHHQTILNLIKDPILAFFLVFCSETPTLQIGGAFVITLIYFLLEAIYRPSIKPGENVRNIISNGIYTLTNFMFLCLHFTEGSISLENKEYFIGVPLIISVTLLILSNYIISMKESVEGIKKRCNKKKDPKEEKNGKKLIKQKAKQFLARSPTLQEKNKKVLMKIKGVSIEEEVKNPSHVVRGKRVKRMKTRLPNKVIGKALFEQKNRVKTPNLFEDSALDELNNDQDINIRKKPTVKMISSVKRKIRGTRTKLRKAI